MAITDIPQGRLWGGELFPAVTTLTMSNVNSRFAWTFPAPKTGNIRKFRWRTGSVTTLQPIVWSFQGRDATTGHPDGVVAELFVKSTYAASTWYADTFSADRPTTQGEPLTLVLDWQSTQGSIGLNAIASADYNSIYASVMVSGVWQKGLGATNRGFIGYFEYDDGSFAVPVGGSAGFAVNTDFGNTSTYREMGVYFQVPAPIKVSGMFWDGRVGADCDVLLYDPDGTTVLRSRSIDKDFGFGSTTTNTYCLFSSDIVLYPGNWYRLVIKPTTASTVRLNWLDFDVVGALALNSMIFGVNGYLTRKDSGGTWSQVNTTKPYVGLIIDGIDFSSGFAYPINGVRSAL